MALTIAHSLGSRGVEVIGGDDVGLTVLSFSRYVRANFVHQSAANEPEGFIDDLEAAILKHKPADGRPYVLIPCFEETRLIARHADRLSRHITVAAPQLTAIQAVDPKDHLMRTARGLNVRIPAACTAAEWRAGAQQRPSAFPMMVKPPRGVGGRGVHRIDDLAALEAALARAEAAGEGLLIQDFVPGQDYCLTVLAHNGDLVATAAYRNLSQFPRAAGAGVLRETVSEAPFVATAASLFGPLAWSGVAEVDFRWDGTGAPCLIEVNPRFWAGLFHSVETGVDFPWLLYELAVSGRVTTTAAGRIGERTKVAGLYLLSAIEEVAASEESFAAARTAWAAASVQFRGGRLLEAVGDLARAVADSPGDVARAATRLRDALVSAKHAPNELFRSDDPLVSLGALYIVASLIRHGRLPPELGYDPAARDLMVE
jgi:predicted ATP-grasp superfamily ATP-dependent carboligase